MDLKIVSRKLNQLAPTTLAGSWDNVGLLVEPSSPHTVNSIFLTNDLTLPVMEEAVNKKADLILSYHPPIFRPLKRLTQSSWKEAIVVKCLENRIAVYSPHTSFDAVVGGVNDWLISPFCKNVAPIETVQSKSYTTFGGSKLDVSVPESLISEVLKQLKAINGAVLSSNMSWVNGRDTTLHKLSLNCTEKSLPLVVECLSQWEEVKSTIEIMQLSKPPVPHHGPGRFGKLDTPTTLSDMVMQIKLHLKLNHIRLAVAVGKTQESVIKSMAVCAGSGSSVLHGVKADLYLTGEMSHHEVLDATHGGASVVLCDHSNTERGFLSDKLQPQLTQLFEEKVKVIVSEEDQDPLQIL